jgi:hypothetical protein
MFIHAVNQRDLPDDAAHIPCVREFHTVGLLYFATIVLVGNVLASLDVEVSSEVGGPTPVLNILLACCNEPSPRLLYGQNFYHHDVIFQDGE